MNNGNAKGARLAKARAIVHENGERRAREAGIILPDEVEYIRGDAGEGALPDKCTIKATVAVKGYRCGGCAAEIPPGELYAFVKTRTAGQWGETRLCGKCGMARVTLENGKS